MLKAAGLIATMFLAGGGHHNPYLERGIQQVRHLNEAAALRTLEQARSWSGTSPEELAQIDLWIGLAHAGMHQPAKARSNFRAALVLDPNLQLPDDASPLVRQWWHEAGGANRHPPVEPEEPKREVEPPQPPASPIEQPPAPVTAPTNLPPPPEPVTPPPSTRSAETRSLNWELSAAGGVVLRDGRLDPIGLVELRRRFSPWALLIEAGGDGSSAKGISIVEGLATLGFGGRLRLGQSVELEPSVAVGAILQSYFLSLSAVSLTSGTVWLPGVWVPVVLRWRLSPQWSVGLRAAGALVRSVEHLNQGTVLWESGPWRVELGAWVGLSL